MNGERIKTLMDEKGISYSELSDMSGVTKPTLQRYATGKTKNIPIDAISRIAAALNTSAAYLMGFTNERLPYDSILGMVADDNGMYEASALLLGSREKPSAQSDKKAPALSAEALSIAKDYSVLDNWGKTAVRELVSTEKQRCEDEERFLADTQLIPFAKKGKAEWRK